MKYKIYLRTKAKLIDEQIQLYENVFNAKTIKKGFWKKSNYINGDIEESEIGTTNFAYLSLLNNDNLKLLIAKYRPTMPTFGFSMNIILTFDKNESLFDEIYENLINNEKFQLIYPKMIGHWNTLVVNFLDMYGFSWILELDKR